MTPNAPPSNQPSRVDLGPSPFPQRRDDATDDAAGDPAGDAVGSDRRRQARFVLPAAYTPVVVRRADDPRRALDGHAYDVSEGGLCFELDEPIEPGAWIEVMVELPEPKTMGSSPSSAFVRAIGEVMWVDDDGARGPVRIAARFEAFPADFDRQRLAESLASGRFSRAA